MKSRKLIHKKTSPKLKKLRHTVDKIKELEGQVSQVVQQMKEKVRQLECMNEISSILNSTLNPELVRERALQATCQLLGCETASIFLIDPEKGDLYWETALGDVGKELKEKVRLPINDKSIAGYVAMTGESLLIRDVSRDARHFEASRSLKGSQAKGFKTQNMLCVPLQTKNKIIGVLQAINKSNPHFSEDDLKMLLTLSHQVATAIENSQLYTRLKRGFYETVEALAEAIEKKDRYTGGHTKRVVYYSECIGKYMTRLEEEERDQLRLAALLHDVGKIGIEDKILKKDSPLNEYEWPVMKQHPELGYEIMKRVESLKSVVGGMRFHHERWDGKGYPLGLKGEEIPMVARIISVADTYDAMVSTRSYRKGLDPKIAYDEIVKHSGSQFCPTVVEAFVKAFQNEKMGKGSGGSRLSVNLEKKSPKKRTA